MRFRLPDPSESVPTANPKTCPLVDQPESASETPRGRNPASLAASATREEKVTGKLAKRSSRRLILTNHARLCSKPVLYIDFVPAAKGLVS